MASWMTKWYVKVSIWHALVSQLCLMEERCYLKGSVVVKIWPPFKMATRVPHIPALRGTSELSSEVHAIQDLIKITSTSRLPPFWRLQLRTKQLQQQITLNLRRQLRDLIILHVHNMQCHSAQAVMNSDGFSCMQSQQTSTTNRGRYNVQIVQLRKSRPYPSTSMPTAQSSISRPSTPTKKGDYSDSYSNWDPDSNFDSSLYTFSRLM